MTDPTQKRTRVRFAPSPTGPLHIGGVRTALYNYLFARKTGGEMILRIEDTDTARFVPGAEAYIIEALQWLGIKFDEGVGIGGNYGPYRQSERRDIYREYVDLLLSQGKAYIAFDTPDELDAARRENDGFSYNAATRLSMRNSLTMAEAEVKERISRGEQYVVRFRIEASRTVEVKDLIRGTICVDSSTLDDKVIFKSADSLPTYHLANIVDDHLMEITHVIRGEEWLPSAPLHVLLYEAFGWTDTMPAFAHLSLLLKPDGNGKLSKRDGDRLGFPVFPLDWVDPVTGKLSTGYREAGYLPEAVVNFLALLGWSPGNDREIFDLDELVAFFELTHCSKSGAKFDYEKGRWFNHRYIREASPKKLADYVRTLPALQGLTPDEATLEQVLTLVKERVTLLPQFQDEVSFFFRAPDRYDPQTVQQRWKVGQTAAWFTKTLIPRIEAVTPFTAEVLEANVKEAIKEAALPPGGVMNAARLALVGAGRGPGVFDIMAVIGRENTLERLRKAVETLG